MKRERILGLLGYDSALLRELSVAQCHSMRGAGIAWLLACLLLGLAGAYSAYLVRPTVVSPVLAGIGVTLLTLNLLRVINAGGGSKVEASLQASEVACRNYRPSLIPALVFGVLAAILSQPAQLGFWPDLDAQVEEHRETLIRQHDEAVSNLPASSDYYREELATADFPIFRLKLIWLSPKRALRLTLIMCLLVLLPAFWSRVIAIKALRAYQWQRTRRTHSVVSQLQAQADLQVAELLSAWPSFVPALAAHDAHLGGPSTPSSPWLGRSPS